jgi:hypothetical protein
MGRTGPAVLQASGLPGTGLRNALPSLCRSRKGSKRRGSSPVLLFGRLPENSTMDKDKKFYLEQAGARLGEQMAKMLSCPW